jgi:hypothetical protein
VQGIGSERATHHRVTRESALAPPAGCSRPLAAMQRAGAAEACDRQESTLHVCTHRRTAASASRPPGSPGPGRVVGGGGGGGARDGRGGPPPPPPPRHVRLGRGPVDDARRCNAPSVPRCRSDAIPHARRRRSLLDPIRRARGRGCGRARINRPRHRVLASRGARPARVSLPDRPTTRSPPRASTQRRKRSTSRGRGARRG